MAQSTASKQSELNPVTLGLAALASVVATVAVARFGLAGSLLGAALAPVITTLVKEYGRKPVQGAAVIGQVARQAGRRRGEPAPPAPRRGGVGAAPRSGPVTVHHTPGGRLRRVRWGVVALTSLLAFSVAVAVFTVPDLLAGKSIVSGRDTTFFSPREPAPAADAPAPVESGGQDERPEEEPAPTVLLPEPTETGATEPEPPTDPAPEAAPAPEATPAPEAPAPAPPPAEVAPAP